jgi:hypothetical protein
MLIKAISHTKKKFVFFSNTVLIRRQIAAGVESAKFQT